MCFACARLHWTCTWSHRRWRRQLLSRRTSLPVRKTAWQRTTRARGCAPCTPRPGTYLAWAGLAMGTGKGTWHDCSGPAPYAACCTAARACGSGVVAGARSHPPPPAKLPPGTPPLPFCPSGRTTAAPPLGCCAQFGAGAWVLPPWPVPALTEGPAAAGGSTASALPPACHGCCCVSCAKSRPDGVGRP